MPKIEIVQSLNLSTKEESHLELHSFMNVLNVVFGNIELMQRLADDTSLFSKSINLAENIISAFDARETAIQALSNISDFKALVSEEIAEAEKAEVPENKQDLYRKCLESLSEIFVIVDVRVQEYLARIERPSEWLQIPETELVDKLKAVAEAIENASLGKFRICYEVEEQGENDFLLAIEVKGLKSGTIFIPPILNDSFRDLTANARKYTAPGGVISASLIEEENNVILTVSDTGRGIQVDELDAVVEFGFRGSNTSKDETKGGGYGLTKAYYVCKRFSGRMWLESELGKGTTVTIEIPKP
ncbi:MAG: ATP-binding protein [Planctomycetota bacterium]|jgi:signal transduction histidine kinase